MNGLGIRARTYVCRTGIAKAIAMQGYFNEGRDALLNSIYCCILGGGCRFFNCQCSLVVSLCIGDMK